MAQSPSHKFGQIIGDLLEETMKPVLKDFCNKNNLYLDYKHDRYARPGVKVSWRDKYDNKHDLDFVFEKDGSETIRGCPVAFIECAWRRYTKHSRNKAQEIQSAILPLQDTFDHFKPFIGVILAGVFTNGAIDQLKSRGFHVLYFSYEKIQKSFLTLGLDCYFDEKTTEESFKHKINLYEKLTLSQKEKLIGELLNNSKKEIDIFASELSIHFSRKISLIKVFTLHGKAFTYENLDDAINFIENYNIANSGSYKFERFEIIVRYSNDDKIEASFYTQNDAIKFLNTIV